MFLQDGVLEHKLLLQYEMVPEILEHPEVIK